eukprot:gene26281-32842_t
MSVGEPSSASTEMFQFGSFGNFASTPQETAEPAGVPSTTSAWGAVDESISTNAHESTNAGDWADATSTDSSVVPSIGSIFSKSGLDVSSVRAPPPGLEQNTPSQLSSNKGGVQSHSSVLRTTGSTGPVKFPSKDSAQHAPILQTQHLYPQQQQYSQSLPPGITSAVGNRGSLAGPSNLPYAYSPSFDLASPQFVHPAYSTSGTMLSTLNNPSSTPPASASLPSGTSPAIAGVTQNNLQSQQQQQQYAAAGPFPFYGNPYYNQAAYYYGQQQVPNYFGQQGNRGLYQQQQSPYAADPYNNSTPLYQHGGKPQQFGDSTTYGLPLHQNMNPVAANNAVGTNSNVGSTNKSTSKGNSTSSNSGSSNTLPQDSNVGGNYGYMNPYNPQRLDAQAWQYQQNQAAAAWGGPMMSFPSAAVGSSTIHGGFVQQQQQQQQPTHAGMNVSAAQGGQSVNNNQRSASSGSTPYGGVTSFAGRNNGPTSSAAGTPQGW